MTVPLFQAPIFSPPQRGEPYQPAQLSEAELELIKEEMVARDVPLTEANIRHALEAEEIRSLLDRVGIDPTKKVSATRDGAGMVKVNFEQFRRVLQATVAVHKAGDSA